MSILSRNPVRVYAVIAAALALVIHYVPSLPDALILGLVAALLGLSQPTQARTTPWPGEIEDPENGSVDH